MTISIKHKFQSAKADGVDTTVVQPSNWNDEHNITCAADKVLGRATAGAGVIEEITCTAFGRSLISLADVAALIATLGLSSPPSGSITAYGGATAPTGWLLCDGSAVSRTTYAALFAAIGTAWGAGNGSTTFNLPDLRGAFLRGAGAGLNPASRAVGSYEGDAFASHTHVATVNETAHSHGVYYNTGNSPSSVFGTGALYGSGSTTNTAATKTNLTVTNATTGGTETVPKNFAVLYIIKI